MPSSTPAATPLLASALSVSSSTEIRSIVHIKARRRLTNYSQGVTGATSTALASVCDPQAALVMSLPTRLCGSSLVVSRMVPATRVRHDTTASADTRMVSYSPNHVLCVGMWSLTKIKQPSSHLPRLEHGTKPSKRPKLPPQCPS